MDPLRVQMIGCFHCLLAFMCVSYSYRSWYIVRVSFVRSLGSVMACSVIRTATFYLCPRIFLEDYLSPVKTFHEEDAVGTAQSSWLVLVLVLIHAVVFIFCSLPRWACMYFHLACTWRRSKWLWISEWAVVSCSHCKWLDSKRGDTAESDAIPCCLLGVFW